MIFGRFSKKPSTAFKVASYSPMNIFERILFTLLISFGLYTFFRYAFWWFKPEHIPSNWITQKYAFLGFLDVTLFAILSVVVFFGLILKIGTWFTTWFMKRPVHVAPLQGLKVAFVTCYVPGNEPVSMLKETLIAMRETDYRHDTWVLDEGNSPEVKALSKELGVYYFSRSEIDKYNQPQGPFRKKTKAGNLNSWRNEYESHYDIVAQVDMDHVPHKDYLTKLLGYFKDPTVGFVGIPQIYKNTDNWIARGAAEQTHFYYGPLQQGFYGSDMPFLIGTTHVYRVKAMSEFGGYSPTIAEDYLTGMHFFSSKWKGVYVPEVLAEGLGPVTWVDYFNQQMRWSYGLFEILFKHTKNHFVKMSFIQKLNLLFSQLFYFSGLISLTGLTLTFVYLIAGINSTNMNLWEWIEYSFPAYLSGLLIMVFLHKFYIDPKKEPIFGLRGVFLGQAAALIYAVSFIKFIIRQKLVYKVTSKESTIEKPSLDIFSYHIIVLLYSVLALLISFILQNESPVMRFWVILNIAFMSFIVLTAYWRNIISSLSAFLNYYKFFEFNINKESVLPNPPSDQEKYHYIKSNRRLFISISTISFISLTICTFNFIINNSLMWPLILYLILTALYFLVSLTVYLFSKEFDIKSHELLVKKWDSKIKSSVDIFLPTAGESIEVLKNTWKGVDKLRENYPAKIEIYVLDDAAREEVKALAKIFRYNYEVRPNRGWFKKAGNLRHGFSVSSGEFITIFDADFTPRPDFLKELLPYFYENKSLGLVQSPQYFDIHQNQNWLQRGAGAVQEFFYRFSQPARQNHDASICVGSNAVYRRTALAQTGGTALIEHSEDVHTGFDLRLKGWTLQYIPVILAKGLCPDDMKSFFKQQYRWCMGSMSLLGSKKFWKPKISVQGRASYFSGFLYYIHTAISSFFTPIIPLAILILYPDQVTVRNYLLVLPSIIFVQIFYPLWHRGVHGIETWSVRSIYGWAHLFAITDVLTGRAMPWQPSGTKVKNDNRYLVFRIFHLLFNFIPAVVWVLLSTIKVLQGSLIFFPILIAGLYYLSVTSKITFYLPGINKYFEYVAIPKFRLAIYGVTALSSLLLLFYLVNVSGHQVLSSTNLMSFNKEKTTLRSPVDFETPQESSSLEGKTYMETAQKGNSTPILYRRILSEYLKDNNLSLTKAESEKVVNELVASNPLNLKTGDTIKITSQELALFITTQTAR